MKPTAILFLAYLALCVQCSVPENKSTKKEISTQPIKVGVFDGHGGAQTCIWETVAAIRLDPEMEVCTITTADIANNVLDSIDAIIIPGGSGKSQYLNLKVKGLSGSVPEPIYSRILLITPVYS